MSRCARNSAAIWFSNYKLQITNYKFLSMSVAANNSRTIVERATDDFLRHLRERNSSAHTIKAYSRDLDNFAAYIGSRGWKTIDHIAIRGFLSHLYDKG